MKIKDALMFYRPRLAIGDVTGNAGASEGVVPKEKELLTVHDVASYLGVSRWTVYQWVNQNKIPFVKILGRLLRFDKVEVIDWINKQRVKPRTDFWDRNGRIF
jgi:excisionase family DNA binding protein